MIVHPYKTRKITPSCIDLISLLDESLPELSERSVVVITSKIISLCEGKIVPFDAVDKEQLVAEHSKLYMPRTASKYNVIFTIAHDSLVVGAGIDESNGDGNYVLWPDDIQASINAARAYLRQKYKLKELGVIATDSSTRPLQWGTTGVSVAYSGFEPLKDYIGSEDLFGRHFLYHKNNIVNGLAAAAVVTMGEGAEQTPLAVIEDLDFVKFVDQDPSTQELADLAIPIEDDVYAPLLENAPWHKGGAKN